MQRLRSLKSRVFVTVSEPLQRILHGAIAKSAAVAPQGARESP